MHCWSGSAEDAARSVALGLYLGIGGVLTFRNRGGLAESVVSTPRDRLLLETDAPYLAPVPHRGKRNEPSYLPLIAREVGALTGMSAADVEALTDRNADMLFPRLSGVAG
jgi:TatD DNase family protein